VSALVESVRWLGEWHESTDPVWFTFARHDGTLRVESDSETAALLVRTPDGEMRAAVGDWIIRDHRGDLYPCRPDTFTATYGDHK
jgi:hypothetical protein